MDPASESQLRRAREAFCVGNFDEAVGTIESVAKRHANQAHVLLDCARSFGFCYEIERAELLLDKLLPAVPAESRAAIGMAFHQIFRPTRAVEILEELKSNHVLSLPNLAQLAKLYEQSNRRTEAIEALSQCVDQAPMQPQPKVLLARLQRQSGRLNLASDLLDLVVTSASVPSATLVHAWTELALVRDQQGDYDQAMRACENAKSLLRDMPQVKQQAQRSTAISAAFQKLYAQVESAAVNDWLSQDLAHLGSRGIAHLIGFPRSGTTLLEQMLDAHPTIYAASERPVFAKAIFPAMCQHGKLSMDTLIGASHDQLNDWRARYVLWHESIADRTLNSQILLDKNPNQTSLMIGLVRAFPDAKFLFALRDPRDVIVSTYMRFFSLTEFSASYLTWEATCELYAHEMNVWLKMRELLPANWLEVKYEDTVSNPQATTSRVCDLLGIPWNENMLEPGTEPQKFVYSPTHAEVRKPIYDTSVGRWRHYAQYLEPYLDRLDPFVKAFGYD